jgi:transcription initiation factor TFIIB
MNKEMNKEKQQTKEQSKKNKNKLINKTKIWNDFNIISNKKPLECLYTNSKNDDICERCNSILCFSEEGFLNCINPKCGIIYKNTLDQTAEWRFYGADDNHTSDPNRVGMPVNDLLEESSYGCKIICSGQTSYEMKKIRRYTEWQSIPYKQKTQYENFQFIKIMAQNAGIPLIIINDALRYHKKITEYEQTFRGENKDGLIAASVYISCRINNYPRTAKELATIFNLDNTSATRGCKNAQIIINQLEKNDLNKDKTSFCKTKPESFIERYCSKLNFNSELTSLCKFICIIIEEKHLLQENAPHSIAGGIIYYVSQICNLNTTKTEIKNISEISEVTINKVAKKMLEFDKKMLIPSMIQKKYNILIE